MTKRNKIVLAFALCACFVQAQNWSLKISSHIGFRKYVVDTKAIKDETVLGGASIKLYKGDKVIDQTFSDGGGYFSIFVPANDEFELKVTKEGCFTKKIYINTKDVPEEAQKLDIKPSISIEGFILSKPLPGIDYSGLEQTLAKIVYIPKDKNFGDEEMYTKEGLALVARIEEAEMALINSFCEANKAGDEAVKKEDCVLAKKMYTNAMTLLPGEQYPVTQMSKVGECFKTREEIAKRAEEMIAKQAMEEKYVEALKKADDAFNTKNWTIAKEGYTEALSVKGSEQYPKYKLAAVEKMIAEEAVAKSNADKAAEAKAKYDAAVKRGDDLFAKRVWTDAEDAYYEALGYLSNEKYPKTQIVAINKMLSREFPGNDKKYKDAIAKTSKLEPEYVQAIKKTYEDALTYESDASYLKKKTNEPAAPVKNSEHVKAMLAKYPAGLTEEIINGNGVVIIKRVLIKDGDAWVYQKKIFNWGGTACFRDDATITESIFENETRL